MEQQIRELQPQLEEAGRQQAAVKDVSRAKIQKAMAISEDMMLEHLSSHAHEDELISLLVSDR